MVPTSPSHLIFLFFFSSIIINRVCGQTTPTSSPIEFSNRTIYNDGGVHVINSESTSFLHETIIVNDKTTLRLEDSGYIIAPDNSDGWPAVRLSISGIFNGTGGLVRGSRGTLDNADGGEAIEMYNGQSSPDTASFGYFYDGIDVIGGDALGGVGGSALHVHGFGTEAYIYGGSFKGGQGLNGDVGLSINVLNSAKVHIYSGSFEGGFEVGDSSIIALYGCFMRNDTIVTGAFVDETNVEVKVRERNGGSIELISVSEQECDEAPSTQPTNFPTISHQPTESRPNGGYNNKLISIGLTFAVHTFCISLCWIF